jgi:transposase-like protein
MRYTPPICPVCNSEHVRTERIHDNGCRYCLKFTCEGCNKEWFLQKSDREDDIWFKGYWI